ncbi:hypothetical protein ASPZODRAFT_128314 [Penicilliopsis zonata CBS 506.65]|uniref:Luciferase domain-containing protein n=1 Tax=Penicilliopsis zonata CBS 506.65 TaxID=1073090 RepID=A0A1L9SRN4_9EURO|nr:hypothetical protein ASPZODRAFT_128314 [Penicilliopsis zonata CBS 506.65]OJJ49784.1 hypothetical protein ASPZODRAFT_128314 [Penicilliopsis zonata CBS 506.65]
MRFVSKQAHPCRSRIVVKLPTYIKTQAANSAVNNDTLFFNSVVPLYAGPVFSAALILLPILILAQYVRRDYRAFIALGPGGTPSTPRGYLRICVLRLFTLRNPLHPPAVAPTLSPQQGILTSDRLPARNGSRPRVAGIAPQRQVTQQGDSAAYESLAAALRRLAHSHPEKLYTATSCFEKHSTGVFVHAAARVRPTCSGEVCHAHPSDGSLHLTLHPADVRLVLDRGWGQRHPLAREGWWWRRAKFVPPGFVMVYAPRDAKELRSVLEIVRAAAWWVSGRELALPDVPADR